MTLIQSFRGSVGFDGNITDHVDVRASGPILHHTWSGSGRTGAS